MSNIFEKIREKLEYARVNCIPRINGRDCSVEELNVYNMAFTYAEKLLDEVEKEAENDDWIPCKVKMPPEHDSMFKKLKGTRAWKVPMFETESDYVIATIEYENGERAVKTLYTTDGHWKTGTTKCTVIAWQPLPKPYREVEDE